MYKESGKLACASAAVLLALSLWCADPSQGQDSAKSADAGKTAVQISFVPPPIETATYSVGIYEAKTGKLVRRLCEAAPQSAFTVGLNGLITSWDGKDEAGKAVPPGRYAAKGYAVGSLKVEGTDILGNDWAADDENLRIKRVEAICIDPEDNGVAILGTAPGKGIQVARFGGEKSEILWQKTELENPAKVGTPSPPFALVVQSDALLALTPGGSFAYRLKDGERPSISPSPVTQIAPSTSSSGKDGTIWKIEKEVLSQFSSKGEQLRSLLPREGEPVPVAVSASKNADRLYLLEETRGWQRVRGLSWVETKQENGKQFSTWQTFFERNIRAPDPSLGLDENPMPKSGSSTVEITLEENPLSPGKQERAKLTGTFDGKGSYLATADGLRLRQISQRANLISVKLIKDKAPGAITFFQWDGAAWDEFSIAGAKDIASFDAGEFDMTATGEKPSDAKAPEPDL